MWSFLFPVLHRNTTFLPERMESREPAYNTTFTGPTSTEFQESYRSRAVVRPLDPTKSAAPTTRRSGTSDRNGRGSQAASLLPPPYPRGKLPWYQQRRIECRNTSTLQCDLRAHCRSGSPQRLNRRHLRGRDVETYRNPRTWMKYSEYRCKMCGRFDCEMCGSSGMTMCAVPVSHGFRAVRYAHMRVVPVSNSFSRMPHKRHVCRAVQEIPGHGTGNRGTPA